MTPSGIEPATFQFVAQRSYSGAVLSTVFMMVRFVAGIFLSLMGKCVDILPASKNRYEVPSVSDVRSQTLCFYFSLKEFEFHCCKVNVIMVQEHIINA